MDKDNIMIIEYKDYIEMVAIFNRKRISEADVVELIVNNTFSEYVIHMSKLQYDLIFGDDNLLESAGESNKLTQTSNFILSVTQEVNSEDISFKVLKNRYKE